MKTRSAGRPARHRARNAASVASPRKRRWAPSCQPAPGAIPPASRSYRSQRLVEVEPLWPGPFLPLVEASEQVLEIGLGEAAQRQVAGRRGAQVDQQAGQQVGVPLPADLVQRHVEQAGVLHREVEQDHGHRREAGAAGGDEPLVAGDHAPVGAAGEHGVDDPERGDRAGQGRQLCLLDAARVARIGMQIRDRQLLHLQGGGVRGRGSLRSGGSARRRHHSRRGACSVTTQRCVRGAFGSTRSHAPIEAERGEAFVGSPWSLDVI